MKNVTLSESPLWILLCLCLSSWNSSYWVVFKPIQRETALNPSKLCNKFNCLRSLRYPHEFHFKQNWQKIIPFIIIPCSSGKHIYSDDQNRLQITLKVEAKPVPCLCYLDIFCLLSWLFLSFLTSPAGYSTISVSDKETC